MKIALVRQRYTAFGGAERFVSRAIDALRSQGAEITLITRSWSGDEQSSALICNPFYLGNVWRDWSFAHCVCTTLKNQSFDLVQSHERISCCDIYRAGDGVHREWLRQRRRTLGFFGKLGLLLNPYHHYVQTAEKHLFSSPRLQAVICNSHMVKKEIQHYFGLPENKLHVIYSGVDTDTFHPHLKTLHRDALRSQYGIPEQAVLFLLIGSGFERKGLPTLLLAMQRLPATTHLMVVGKDKHLAQFKAKTANLGLADRVHFAGGQKDVQPFYGAADVFVLPTLYDPFPNAILEAMASGLPVITSQKCGAAELIRNGENGYVCDALDTAELARQMSSLLPSESCMKAGATARHTVEPMSLAQMSSQLLQLYQSLIRV